MNPEQTYASMSPEQIVEFCRANLPRCVDFAVWRPDGLWLREMIIAELTKRPLLIEKGSE